MSKGYAVKKSANKSSFYKVVPSDNVKIDTKMLPNSVFCPNQNGSNQPSNFTQVYGFQIFDTGQIKFLIDCSSLTQYGVNIEFKIKINNSIEYSFVKVFQHLWTPEFNVGQLYPFSGIFPVKIGDYITISFRVTPSNTSSQGGGIQNLKFCYDKVLHEEV